MVLSSAPLPPQHLMMTTEPNSKIMADPQPSAVQVGVGQMLFGQNQQETGLGGAQNVFRGPQQGMQFRFPEAGGVQGSVQYRPQYLVERSSCQPAAWNTMTTSGPQEPLMRISGELKSHGNSSPWGQQASWNPPQSRIPPNGKSGWNIDSQECRRLPHTAVFRGAAARGGPYSGTFGTLHHKQSWGPTADRRPRVPSTGSGVSSRHRRRKRPSSEDEGPSSKMFLSEEKMAAHLNKLSISNDHNYVGMATRFPGSSPRSPSQDKNRVIIEDLSDDSSDEWTSSSDSDVGSTIQISPELQQGMQQVAGERLLPDGLFERLNRPCMDVVLWKPPGDFVQSVINCSSPPKQQITPSAVQSEPSLLTQDNSSPVIRNHGDREMIDTEVMDHVPQPAVSMFDSVDDDMEL